MMMIKIIIIIIIARMSIYVYGLSLIKFYMLRHNI